MTNGRKAKRLRRGAGRRDSRLRLVSGQGAEESTRSGTLHMVRSGSIVHGTPAAGAMPAIPETAAKSIHVVIVSLHGAAPPPWRRLELSSAMTLDRLHVVLSETFGWSDFGQHSFVTIYGEFGDPMWRAARHAPDQRDDSGITLAQAAGEEGLGMAYMHGFEDNWRVDVLVEKIQAAEPGVAYPRCTGGQGADVPGEEYAAVWEFNAEREPWTLDEYFSPEDLTEDLSDMAEVIVRRS
jgi:pRiA4b ORF-3-like protein